MKITYNSNDRNYSAAIDISQRIQAAGGKALFVGGCVRDAIMRMKSDELNFQSYLYDAEQIIYNASEHYAVSGQNVYKLSIDKINRIRSWIKNREVNDFDIEIYGLNTDQIISALAEKYEIDTVGMSFGVMKVKHFNIDLTLPRTENKIGTGHRGFIIETRSNITFKEASARRDFTINAIMYDPLNEYEIDEWNGIRDISNMVLRHVSPHFSEDPLRVLRCMQFAGRFCFKVAKETINFCKNIPKNELAIERIEKEWEKLLINGLLPSLGLRFLRKCGWIENYPELNALIGCKQTPKWHPEGDVWEHTARVLDCAAELRSGNFEDDLLLMFSALCHDFGKPETSVSDNNGVITSYNHEIAGEKKVLNFVKRISLREDLFKKIGPFVRHHMQPYAFGRNNVSDKAYRKLSVALNGRIDLLYKLALSDSMLQPGPKKILDIFYEKAKSLNVDKEPPPHLILGRHIIERGVKPGRQVGILIAEFYEKQLSGQFKTLEEGLLLLDTELGKK